MALTRLLVCLLGVLLPYHVTTGLNSRPIIGVLAQETDSSTYGDTYIPATYIKYIESAGAQVVPIRVKEPEDYYEKLFNSINGVLFPGGDVDIITSEYAQAGKLLFLMAIQAHDKGDYFPVWGTCLGFQLLTAITAGQDLLTKFDSTNVNWPLNFTQDAQKSHLLGGLPRDVHQYLTKENVTENYHEYGISPETFNGNPALSKFYTVLSTNMDRNGKVFISTMEAKKYPIFGTQWHPEKNLFQWNPKYDINHDAHAVRVSQYFASFLVSEVMALTRLLICLLSVLLPHHLTTGLNLRPIIGVLAQETGSNTYGDTYIPATYIKYIESAGAQVVPIRVKETEDYYRNLFNSINGVLFPGGGVDIITSEYAKAGKLLFLMAVQAHDKGDYFPVWGTCLGFQLLTAITAGQDLLTKFDSINVNWPLNFTQDAQKSRLLGGLPRDVHQYLTKENVTENYHQYGMSPETFNGNPALSKFYTVLSTNLDRKGKIFISAMEAKRYPIFGVQWHPEKNLFKWNPKYDINHDAHAVRVSQYFASFLVSEARKSNHTFPSMKDEADAVIANYQPVYSNDGSFEQIYYFNYTRIGLKSLFP